MILHRMRPKLRLKHHRRLRRRVQLQLSLDRMLRNEDDLKTYSQSLLEKTEPVTFDKLIEAFEHVLEPSVTHSSAIFDQIPSKMNLQL